MLPQEKSSHPPIARGRRRRAVRNALCVLAGLVLLPSLSSCGSRTGGDSAAGDVPADEPGPTADKRPASALPVVRGHYRFGHEIRELRPCGRDEVLWVVDRTGLLKILHEELITATSRDAEIFVVTAGSTGPPPAEGFGADYAGSIAVTEVFYAAFEGFGCDFDWSRFALRAQGNEPFWTLELAGNEIRLNRPGVPEWTWTGVQMSRAGEAMIIEGRPDTLPPIRLVVEAKPSRDDMSGAYYGLSAQLELGGQSYQGNALRGSGSFGP
jgi:putative lipoprotein